MAKVMVCDDEAIITMLLEEYLTATSHEVVGVASSGKESVEAARRLKPDVIIMDIVMPGEIDGIEAARIIKTDLDIPVIFLTAYSDFTYIEKAKEAEPYGYLTKPFQENEIKVAVEIALYKKEMETRLRESEKHYRLIVEMANEGIWQMDSNYTTSFVNTAMAEMLGYLPDEMIGKPVYSFMFEEDLGDHNERMETRMQGLEEEYERRFRRKDGSELQTIVSATPLTDKNGDFVGSFAMVTDITKRKQMETALQEGHDNMQSILTSSPVGMIVFDDKGQILFANPAAERMFKRKLAELEHRRFGNFISCWNGKKDSSGCGYSPDCPSCPLFRNIKNVISGGLEVYDQENEMAVESGEGCQNIWCRYSICPVVLGGLRCAVMAIDDITARKQNEKELQTSECKFRKVFQCAPVLMTISNIDDGTCIDANEQFFKVSGFSPEETIGKSSVELGWITPEDRRILYQTLQAQGHISGMEIKFNARDKRQITCICSGETIMVDNRLRLLLIAQDVTEHRRTEQEYRILFREMLDGFALHEIICDAYGQPVDFRTLAVNPAFERITGLHAEDVIGRTLLTVMPNIEHSWIENYGRVVLTGKPASFEGYAADLGKYFSVMAFRPAAKQFACIIEDITERKHKEEAIKDSEERYRAVIENSMDGIALVRENIHIFVNQRFVDIFGYNSKEEIIGKGHSVTVHPDDLGRVTEISRERHGNGTAPVSYEFKGIKKDGSTINIEALATKIVYNNEFVTLAYLRDVTEHKKLEDEFRQSQKLEAVGQLAGGIAHDFNNILTIIIGFASVLQMDMAPGSPSGTYVGEILSAAEKAASLTQSLLAFSRKQVITLKPLDLNAAIRTVKKLLMRIISEDIEFKTMFSGGKLIVMADTGQFDQIIMNIVVNSCDAMPHGGKLVISTKALTIDGDFISKNGFGEKGEYALVSVTDTGIGMDDKTVERIFEPFYTTKEVGKGTGLGLSTVYGIVKQHKGYITVESKPGKGTTFSIYLPRVKLESKIGRATDYGNIPSKGQATILLAEDEEGVRKFIKATLERFGYNIIEAVDGDDALEKFTTWMDTIQLVLTDLVMPKKTGAEIHEKIAEIKPDIPVIYMSGYSEDILQQKGLHLDESRYISKPTTPQELLKKIEKTLKGT